MQIENLLDGDLAGVEPRLLERITGENAIDDCRTRLLLDLVQHLRRQGPAPRAFGFMVGDVLWLSPANAENLVWVKIWVDSHDYGVLGDGVRDMHFRVECRRGKDGPLTDARVESPEGAEAVMWEAFGWKQ